MMERTQSQIDASRRNGALSHGPATLEGKQKSSRNSLRHGFRSAPSEPPAHDPNRHVFEKLRALYFRRFTPRTPEEHTLVDMAVHCAFQLARIHQAERAMPLEFDPNTIVMLDRFGRYRASFERTFLKVIKELDQMQSKRTGDRAEKATPDTGRGRACPAHATLAAAASAGALPNEPAVTPIAASPAVPERPESPQPALASPPTGPR
jgi:hypothetical protein